MWTKVKQFTTAALFVASFLCFPCVGLCSEGAGVTYTITDAELTTLETHLTALQTNNETLTNILNESTVDLQTARDELTQLREALTKSRTELESLSNSLTALRAESQAAKASLKTANEELQKALQSVEASERERDRIEGRLRTQRNIWEALFAVAVGVAVAR